MKTVMKKVAAIVLVSATVLSLAACSKKAKKLTAAEFKTKMEAEGYSVSEAVEEDGASAVLATNEAGTVSIGHMTFADKDTAQKYFDSLKSIYDLAKGQEGMKISTSSTKLTVESDENYGVMILAEDTMISASAQPATDENIDACKSALKALGY